MTGFFDGSGISWTICKQSAPHSRQITTPTPHYSIFLQARRSSWRPTNSVKALKAFHPYNSHTYYYWYSTTHSLFHFRLKSFLFCKSSLPQAFLFLIQVSLYGFPILFTATSEHIRLFTFIFLCFYTFQLSVPCGRLS